MFRQLFRGNDSHAESEARSAICTAAKYFGAFGAGFPNGTSNFAVTNSAMSCS